MSSADIFDRHATTVRGFYYFYEPHEGYINVSGVASGPGLVKYSPAEALRRFKVADNAAAKLQAWRAMWAYVKYLVVETGKFAPEPNKHTASAVCDEKKWNNLNNHIYWVAWNYYYQFVAPNEDPQVD